MQIINATPHALNFLLDDGRIAVIERSGIVARVDVVLGEPEKISTDAFEGAGIELTIQTRRVNGVVGLPGPLPDTLYIVSTMVADAAYGRDDLVVPGELMRDDAEVIVGCRGLYRVAPACLGG